MKYVNPGHASQSFLLVKLLGGVCPDGSGSAVSKPPSNITQDEIAVIKAWIDQGAQI